MNNINSTTIYLSEPLYFGGYYRVIFDGQAYDLQVHWPYGQDQEDTIVMGNSFFIQSVMPAGVYPVASLAEDTLIYDLSIVPFAIMGYGSVWEESQEDSRSTDYEYDLYAEEGTHTISIVRMQADIKTLSPEMLPPFYMVAPSDNLNYPQEYSLLEILNRIESRLAVLEDNDPIEWVDYPAAYNQGGK